MTDRELLELAAKAAGIDCRISPYGNLLARKHPSGTEDAAWNPLTDDGDALRLAVKLGMTVERRPASNHPFVPVVEAYTDRRNIVWQEIEIGSDPCAATRRAIVRAAAEIGRTL